MYDDLMNSLDFGLWKHSIDNDIPMLECPFCECRVFKYEYLRSIGTHGIRFCPYCGHNLQKENRQISLFEFSSLN